VEPKIGRWPGPETEEREVSPETQTEQSWGLETEQNSEREREGRQALRVLEEVFQRSKGNMDKGIPIVLEIVLEALRIAR
jgi:hypothetical protein